MAFAGALAGSGYMLQLIGATMLVSGVLLVINRFVPLALLFARAFLREQPGVSSFPRAQRAADGGDLCGAGTLSRMGLSEGVPAAFYSAGGSLSGVRYFVIQPKI
ncbi:MAG: hypothetical protein U5L01_02075 [Rheinheimera sp.]|nr:hypothetical protein [Rheinheimera sp.]